MISLLLSASPDAAIIGLTVGFALIALELNRPGLIMPGACGLLLSLLCTAVIIHAHPHPWAASLLVLALAALLAQARQSLPFWCSILAVIALPIAFQRLLPADTSPRFHATTAALCGITLGTGITVLTRIARRARQNKGLD